MKKLNRKEGIAVFAGLGFMVYLLYGSTLLNLFDAKASAPANTQQTMIQSGVQVQDVKVGTGAVAAAGDTLVVHYVGTLPDGRVFDSSVDRNTPFAFQLGTGAVIRGWDEGMVGMRVGGERRLVIAPDYAYGSQTVGSVPANSTLIFDVQLLDVKKK
jgi:FKBP-type peptidyl-prolyl cis-trans isomerase